MSLSLLWFCVPAPVCMRSGLSWTEQQPQEELWVEQGDGVHMDEADTDVIAALYVNVVRIIAIFLGISPLIVCYLRYV